MKNSFCFLLVLFFQSFFSQDISKKLDQATGQRHLVPLVLVAVLPVVLVYLLMRYVLSVPMP